jgi:hypothetical protein
MEDTSVPLRQWLTDKFEEQNRYLDAKIAPITAAVSDHEDRLRDIEAQPLKDMKESANRRRQALHAGVAAILGAAGGAVLRLIVH